MKYKSKNREFGRHDTEIRQLSLPRQKSRPEKGETQSALCVTYWQDSNSFLTVYNYLLIITGTC